MVQNCGLIGVLVENPSRIDCLPSSSALQVSLYLSLEPLPSCQCRPCAYIRRGPGVGRVGARQPDSLLTIGTHQDAPARRVVTSLSQAQGLLRALTDHCHFGGQAR